ncbi:nucleic acid-binding protein [Aspergillus varians]
MSGLTSSSLRSLLRAAPARYFSSSSARSAARMNITGRLGNEPELSTSVAGQEYVKYVVASSSGTRDNRTTSWFRIAAFVNPTQRDFLLSLPKGSLVSVDAEASQRKFQDSEGNDRTQLNITQRNLEFLGRPSGARGEGSDAAHTDDAHSHSHQE